MMMLLRWLFADSRDRRVAVACRILVHSLADMPPEKQAIVATVKGMELDDERLGDWVVQAGRKP